jgi:hypothetical protein
MEGARRSCGGENHDRHLDVGEAVAGAKARHIFERLWPD